MQNIESERHRPQDFSCAEPTRVDGEEGVKETLGKGNTKERNQTQKPKSDQAAISLFFPKDPKLLQSIGGQVAREYPGSHKKGRQSREAEEKKGQGHFRSRAQNKGGKTTLAEDGDQKRFKKDFPTVERSPSGRD